MMKLRVSRRKRIIAMALYYGGLVLMIFSGFAYASGTSWGMAAMLACFAVGMAGVLWAQSLYRCPACGRNLIGRGWEGLTMTPYNHCPNCGWKTEIEWTK